jgi:hypothetical protein
MEKKVVFKEMQAPLFGTKEELAAEIIASGDANCYESGTCDECDCWCDCDNSCCDTPED